VNDNLIRDETMFLKQRLNCVVTGHQLRRVEAKRVQSVKRQQRQTSVGQLDVQSIMEAAFEMRRKALEDNDSATEEDRDDADEGDWADD